MRTYSTRPARLSELWRSNEPDGAAENEKAARQRAPVRKHTQQGKKIRGTLHFVDNHEPGQHLADRHRLFEQSARAWIFQVEKPLM